MAGTDLLDRSDRVPHQVSSQREGLLDRRVERLTGSEVGNAHSRAPVAGLVWEAIRAATPRLPLRSAGAWIRILGRARDGLADVWVRRPARRESGWCGVRRLGVSHAATLTSRARGPSGASALTLAVLVEHAQPVSQPA